jgi:hypothetical protein
MIDAAADDPRPGIPVERVRGRLQAQWRRYARTPPPRPRPLPRAVSPQRTRHAE